MIQLIIGCCRGRNLFHLYFGSERQAGDDHLILCPNKNLGCTVLIKRDRCSIILQAGCSICSGNRAVVFFCRQFEGKPGCPIFCTIRETLLQFKISIIGDAVRQNRIFILNLICTVRVNFRSGVLAFTADNGAAPVSTKICYDSGRGQ